MAFFESLRTAVGRFAAGVHELGAPSDERALNAAEKRLGISFPTSHREFLRSFDGANLFHESLRLFAAAEITVARGNEERFLRVGETPDGALYLRSDGGLYLVDEESPDPILSGSSTEAWLDATLAREALLVDRDGEYRQLYRVDARGTWTKVGPATSGFTQSACPTCNDTWMNWSMNYQNPNGGNAAKPWDLAYFISPPGRFVNDFGPNGHMDVGGDMMELTATQTSNQTATDFDGNSVTEVRVRWNKSASFEGHGVGAGYQSGDDSTYSMDFTLNLRYYVLNKPTDTFYVNASLGAAVERELRARVLGGAERGRREPGERVAARAVRAQRGERALVRIGVAARAGRERELAVALRDRPARRVAARARRGLVLARERVAGLAVVVAADRLGQADPADLGVAGLAARRELRDVDRLVAALAPAAARRRLVVAAIVARRARHARVAAGERHHRVVRADLVAAARPPAGVVAGGARLGRELALVRIGVARLAGRERQRLPRRRRAGVALLARDLGVLAGQREPRERVIELRALERLPARRRVALLAAAGEPPRVRILVARRARGRRGQELRPALRRGLGVALAARDLGVGAVERPAGQRVIQLVHRAARPPHQLGVAADVLDVARLARPLRVLAAVQPAARAELAREVLVAVQAQPRDHLGARGVAARAVVIALEVGVRLGERSRRQHLRRGPARRRAQRRDRKREHANARARRAPRPGGPRRHAKIQR